MVPSFVASTCARVWKAERVARDVDALSLSEAVCLALIAERPQHGWALVRALAPGSDVGRVWTLSRPLTYRAIDALLERGLITRKGEVPGAGPKRQILTASARGRRAALRWLATPVAHLRDTRTELLLKLVLGERAGHDTRPLLREQRAMFEPHFAALRSARNAAGADDVDRWRYESSLAVRRFLDTSLRAADSTATSE
jgi:DNA-binding PadR family transcriptional regulator